MTTMTATISCPDAELVQQSLAGDQAAFRQIVERHQSLVCALVYATCGNVHTSEDLAQEVFLQAWKSLPTLREPQRLKWWLCGIARHVAHGAARERGRMPQTTTGVEEMIRSAEPTPAEAA